jgi:drug/metabolite transporter (DMT)-like permease
LARVQTDTVLSDERRTAAAASPGIAIGALVLCCVLWGYSFPVMQLATHAFDRHLLAGRAADDARDLAARALFNGIRFGLAALLYALLTWRRQRGFTRADVTGGAVVGAFFAAGMLLQVTGLRWTFPSVSSFLTALAVVFAPLGQAAILRRPVGGATWVAVGLALVGMTVLGWPKPEAAAAGNSLAAAPPVRHLGEIVTVAAALLFTGQILAVDRFGGRADAVRLTLVMLATTSVLSLAVGASIGGDSMLRWNLIGGIARDGRVLWTMATLVTFSSVAALHLMNMYQPYVSPATASVIYCTEPLFGTAFSLAFATERLTVLTVAGGAAVLAAVLVVALAGKDPVLPSEGHFGQ